MLQLVREFITDAWDAGSKSVRSRVQNSREGWVSDWILINSSPFPLVGPLGIIGITLNITGAKM